MIREWIIFALCLGAGGHIALGVMLHAPDMWPLSTAGLYGLVSGLVLYGFVQGSRILWRLSQGQPETGDSDERNSKW